MSFSDCNCVHCLERTAWLTRAVWPECIETVREIFDKSKKKSSSCLSRLFAQAMPYRVIHLPRWAWILGDCSTFPMVIAQASLRWQWPFGDLVHPKRVNIRCNSNPAVQCFVREKENTKTQTEQVQVKVRPRYSWLLSTDGFCSLNRHWNNRKGYCCATAEWQI